MAMYLDIAPLLYWYLRERQETKIVSASTPFEVSCSACTGIPIIIAPLLKRDGQKVFQFQYHLKLVLVVFSSTGT
jgi:hypothetical protein